MLADSSITTPTQFVKYAPRNVCVSLFRRRPATAARLVLQFLGTLDNWVPAVVNALPSKRQVVLFRERRHRPIDRYRTAIRFPEMARHAFAFLAVLGYTRVDSDFPSAA